jgi:hypothetical protein
LANEQHFDEIVMEAQAWSERPDAFFALILCSAVAWTA